ncbi:MAG: hypothetical protein HKO71_02050 [Pseudomonadales bacterium]|nr:hypothetical protein [Pseudomonadales bacterium]
MKTYETAHEFFATIVSLHEQAARQLLEAMTNCPSERSKMAFTYLHNYQQRMQEGLSHYLQDSEQDKLLDTWLPYSLNSMPAPKDFLSGLEIKPELSADDIAVLGQAIANYVVSLLEDVSGSIASQALAEVMDNLMALEGNERKKFTRAMNSLADM